jgi:hypothetical protein
MTAQRSATGGGNGSVWRLGPSSWNCNGLRERRQEKRQSPNGKTGLKVSGSAIIYMICCYLESRGEKGEREARREQGTTYTVTFVTHGRHECTGGLSGLKEQASERHGVVESEE